MMQGRSLDIDSVEAFVLAADLGSFTRAADVLATSQAAISLRLKRLEDRLGYRLLDRTPRHVRPSKRGAAFLPAARGLLDAHERAVSGLVESPPERLHFGISEHVAGRDLPLILRRLGSDGSLVLEVRVAPSRELNAAFEAGALDAVIVRSEGAGSTGTVLREERLGWFAAPGFAHRPDTPVRLATLACPCGVREAAARALDEAGLPWSEVFVGGGVLAVCSAVSAGLAVAALAPSVAPPDAIEVGERFGLPNLPLSPVVLHARPLRGRAQAALEVLAASYRGQVSARVARAA